MRLRPVLVLLVVLTASSAATAFQWIGKIELDAEGLKDDDPDKRWAAVQLLSRYDDSIGLVKPHLMRALDDPDPKVRAAAGRVLGRFGVLEVLPTVTGWLNAPETALRVSAADILGQLRQRRSAKALIRSLTDQEHEVRLHAVLALGKIATEEAVVPLIARLEDAKADVRVAAITQLAELGDARALIPLVGAMNDPAIPARLAAVRAVGRLGDASAAQALVRLLRDPLPTVKVAAVAALGDLKATEATDRLIEAMSSGGDDFKSRTAYALGQIAAGNSDVKATRRAIRALVGELVNPRTRAGAREALLVAKEAATIGLIDHLRGEIPGHATTAVLLLRDIGDARATPVLLAELERGRVTPEIVLGALGKAGDKRALVPVLSLLSDKDAGLRLAAMRALEPMIEPGSQAADVLLDMLGDRKREIQLLAARYLGVIGDKRASRRLATVAKGAADTRLRVAALAALAQIVDPAVTDDLIKLLLSGPIAVRREASRALMKLGTLADARGPADKLLDLIASRRGDRPLLLRTVAGVLRGHEHPRARPILLDIAAKGRVRDAVAAITALAALGDTKAESDLIKQLDTDSIDRRRALASALGDVGGDASRKRLVRELTHDDDGVAGAAALALGKLGATAAIRPLVRTLKRRGTIAPLNAAAALVMLADRAQPKSWAPMLHHRRRLVRANAALAIGRAGDRKQVAELEYMLAKDPSWTARLNAARALSTLGGKEALARAANGDGRDEVKAAAAALIKTPFVAPPRNEWIVLYVVDPTSNDATVEKEPYFLIGSDGIATAFYSDVLGQATEERFPPAPQTYAAAAAEGEY